MTSRLYGTEEETGPLEGKTVVITGTLPSMGRKEAEELILDASRDPLPWISDDVSRKNFCDDIVKNGSRKELMRLVGMLYCHREELRQQKKHFHNVDAQYLKTAERLLHDELAYALGIPAEQVPDYICRCCRTGDPR